MEMNKGRANLMQSRHYLLTEVSANAVLKQSKYKEFKRKEAIDNIQ